MENNFIQMAASASHEVAHTIGPIFEHIIDCVQLYFTNGFTIICFAGYYQHSRFTTDFMKLSWSSG